MGQQALRIPWLLVYCLFDAVEVWLSFWLLPFGAMFLALVGDEMGDLVLASATFLAQQKGMEMVSGD